MRDNLHAPARTRRGSAGFTIIEVLVSLLILAVGIVGTLEAFQTALTALGAAHDSLRADALIADVFADVEGGTIQYQGRQSRLGVSFDADQHDGFRWELNSSAISQFGRTTLYLANVTVTRGNLDRRYLASSYFVVTQPE